MPIEIWNKSGGSTPRITCDHCKTPIWGFDNGRVFWNSDDGVARTRFLHLTPCVELYDPEARDLSYDQRLSEYLRDLVASIKSRGCFL